MLYRYLTLFFFIFQGLALHSLFPQELKYRSDIITRDNGLSNSSISCIFKDKYGFLWFGTWNGLNRYDGYDMTVFLSNAHDSSTISNSNINTIFEDREGLLWIATDNGLNSYDQITGRFKRYYFHQNNSSEQLNNQINCITQDVSGFIWAGCQDGGIIRLNKKSGAFKQFINHFSERSNTIIALEADSLNSKYLWLGTADGFFRFDKSTGNFDRKNQGISETPIWVQVISQDKYGNLYLGTWGNGLLKYDRKTSTLLSCAQSGSFTELIKSGVIRTMSFDNNGDLIFNVRDKGLMSYNPNSGLVNEMNDANVNYELNDKSVTSLYIDPSGIFWIGTVHDGVIKIVSLINSFDHYNPEIDLPNSWNGGGITAILEDSKGFLWLGTRFGGIFKINRKTREYTLYRQMPGITNTLASNNILSLVEVKKNNQTKIWIGTDGGGLNCLDPGTGKFVVYKSNDKKSAGPSSNIVSSIIQYDNDHLLIGTRDRNFGEGLDVFNIKTGKFINFRYNPSDSTSLGSNNILKIFKDRTGTVWLGTRNGGLNKFIIRNINAETSDEIGYFVRYTNDPSDPTSLSNNTIYSIHDDGNNNLWIGTNGGGLTKFNPLTGAFTGNILDQYLKDQLIYGILTDENENLWISTSRGIIVFNHETNQVHSFDKYDGLQESAFIYGSYFRSVSGEMFFGGIKGCNSFHPDSIKLNLKVPKIVITSMNLSGKKGSSEVTNVTGKSVLASKYVRTPYYQNNFSISFSALDFHMPAKNRFKYKLSGYDEEWMETDSRRRYVNYTNLPPGKYVFKVIGSNSDDIWNHEGTSVTIQIDPPFWKTTSFYILITLFLVGLVGIAFYILLKKYQEEKRQVEMEALSSLQDERKQLRTLIDNIPDIIFIKDCESRFTVGNIKVATIMGTTEDQLIGKTDFDFYPKEVAQKFYDDEQKIIKTGIPLINHEEHALDEHGNRVIRSTTKVPIKNKDGEIIGLVGVCRDITKLKQIENQLRKKTEDLQETNRLLEARQKEILIQSEELADQTQHLLMINSELDRLVHTKDKFFSIIAHDLRNPFNAIIGFSELLRNDFYDMDNAQKLNVLELISVSSQTAYNLLENLLHWARTQTDKIDFNPEDFDLSEMVSSVIDLNCIMAGKKGVKINNKISLNTCVYADKNMIYTVLRNLVSNAIKFSNPDGCIDISVILKNDSVEVNVSDDGIGMNRESLGKLFRIDTYYSTSGTMGETGTGLGLIICKEFIEKNNGRIKAISSEGSGTTMTFTLNHARFNTVPV